MLIVNSINKEQLRDDGSSFGGGLSSTAWRARLILFLGFALMAGGLAGSVVRSFSFCAEYYNPMICVHLCSSSIESFGPEIYRSTLRRSIPLLRVRQCGAECVADAVGDCALARTASIFRIRV